MDEQGFYCQDCNQWVMRSPHYIQCIYCKEIVECTPIPDDEDYKTWRELEYAHSLTCEWVRTRAFRGVDA